MKPLYEVTMINTGGRDGEVHSEDKSFSMNVKPAEADVRRRY